MRFRLRKKGVSGNLISDFILGGQDGLVNVLASVLGVAAAIHSRQVIIIAGFAALAAESISMAAVAYTSSKALRDYYKRKRQHGDWLKNPVESAFIVGTSSLIGSIIPLIPFFFFSVKNAMISSVIVSIMSLFIAGAIKAKLTVGDWKRSGTEMAVIGTVAALAGYLIGVLLGVVAF